jgi:hypothetical protein
VHSASTAFLSSVSINEIAKNSSVVKRSNVCTADSNPADGVFLAFFSVVT